MFIAAQVIGILAVATYLLSYQLKYRGHIVVVNGLSSVLYVLQYALLGSFDGAASDTISALSALTANYKDKGRVKQYALLLAILFNLAIVGAGLALYRNPYSLCAVAGAGLQVSALWLSDEKKIRLVSFLGTPFWLAFNLEGGTVGASVGTVLSMGSLASAIFRYDIYPKIKGETKPEASPVEIMKINDNIYRTAIPYKDIFTTVYVVKTPGGAVLFDAASFDQDVENYIIPFLRKTGVGEEELKYIFISHNHRDHAGGLPALLPKFPNVCVVSRSDDLAARHEGYTFLKPEDNDALLDVLRVVTIPGHTTDSMALLDTRTGTMLTGDCLQLYGIYGSGPWGANIGLPVEHMQAVEKVRGLDIEEIFTAHDYHPCGYHYCGGEQVTRALDSCIAPILKVKELLSANPDMDNDSICKLYNDAEYLPNLNARLVSSVRSAMAEGRI